MFIKLFPKYLSNYICQTFICHNYFPIINNGVQSGDPCQHADTIMDLKQTWDEYFYILDFRPDLPGFGAASTLALFTNVIII